MVGTFKHPNRSYFEGRIRVILDDWNRERPSRANKSHASGGKVDEEEDRGNKNAEPHEAEVSTPSVFISSYSPRSFSRRKSDWSQAKGARLGGVSSLASSIASSGLFAGTRRVLMGPARRRGRKRRGAVDVAAAGAVWVSSELTASAWMIVGSLVLADIG